ncbi:hypothetical protein PG999_005354 [Apiospora kogelbergensis]|uniref:Short-chain dehydrogenase n=1 Tax=Apiospora kogelbergensis TaxID=1337665 RepID=A0AAW0R1Y8_9PEZI
MPSYVVSGASRGLGYAFIKVLASDPANKVIGLARDKKATEDRLKEDGFRNVHILTADVTDEAALRQAAAESSRLLDGKGLDVLINNAGYVSDMSQLKPLTEFEDDIPGIVDDAQKSFNVNVIGVLRTTYAFLPLIQQGDLKKVATISSGMGDLDFVNEFGVFQAAPYAVSKAATSLLVAKFQAGYRDQGILFFSICPGLVDTDATRTSPNFGQLSLATEENLARLAKIAALFQEKGVVGGPPMDPMVAARRSLAAIDRFSLEGGYGGSLLSHNGTRRWMEPAEE